MPKKRSDASEYISGSLIGLDMMRDAAVKHAQKLESMREKEKEGVYQRMREDTLRQRLGVTSNDYRERLELARQKAEFDAANFEKRYTAKQKAELSQLKNALPDIDSNPDFTDQQKIAAKRAIQAKIMGIQPSDLPNLSPYPKGRGPGEPFDIPGAGKWMMTPDGKSYINVSSWKNSPEQQAMQDARNKEKEDSKALTKFMNTLKYDEESKTDRFPNAEEIRQFQIRQGGYEGVRRSEIAQQREEAGLPAMPEASQAVKPDAVISGDLVTPDAELLTNPVLDEETGKQIYRTPQEAAGFRKSMQRMPEAGNGLPVVKGEDDWKLLAPGAEFIGPDGKKYRKNK